MRCEDEVRRRASSSSTSEAAVALFRMTDVSPVSTMKVDLPEPMSSVAPTRVNTRSASESVASVAGTNEPDCARIWIAPSMRR